MKTCFLFLLTLLAATALFGQAQDVIGDTVLLSEHLARWRYDLDTGADAIILSEKGTAFLEEQKLTFRVERTIKILSQKAASELSVIQVPYDRDSWVSDVSGATYNLEHGKVVVQPLARPDLLRDKLSREFSMAKFSLPAVKVGSVIHYTYTKEQPAFLFVPAWYFQGSYPALVSAYEVNLPGYVVYTAIERVNVPMGKIKREKQMDTCQACFMEHAFGSAAGGTWTRRNIPAVGEEPFMISPHNYMERVKVHVTGISRDGIVSSLYKDWDEFSRKFYYGNKEFCGQVFGSNTFLDSIVAAVSGGQVTPTEKARALYAYVRGHFAVTEYPGEKLRYDIKAIFQSGKGSVEGINLLLTAMLRKAGLESVPVLLSTKDEEMLHASYPDPQLIDYLVSKVSVGNRDYFLDAAAKGLPFGSLPPGCYNGYCRLVSSVGGAAVLEADSIRDKTTVLASLAPAAGAPGTLVLKVSQQFGVYSSWYYRDLWKNDTTAVRNKVLQYLGGSQGAAMLQHWTLKNRDKPDEPLVLQYEAAYDLEGQENLVYMDPYFFRFYDTNPFPAATRKYAVAMDYLQDINYVFRLQLPAGYRIEDYPESSLYRFGTQSLAEMKNVVAYDTAGNTLSLNSRLITRTTHFSADEYDNLHRFYGHVVGDQKKKIVIKRD